jgi:hypothetical protein
MAKSRKVVLIPPLTPKQAQDMLKRVEDSTKEFVGLFDELESAIGMYMIGRLVGWRVLVLIHNKRTIRKYEEILGGIDIRKEFPEEGPLAHKSLGLEIVKKVGNFWKAVSGEQKLPERRTLTEA